MRSIVVETSSTVLLGHNSGSRVYYDVAKLIFAEGNGD